MKPLHIATAFLLALPLRADVEAMTFVTPDELKSTTVEIPPGKNNLTLFLQKFSPLSAKQSQPIREARASLDRGKQVGNDDLLVTLRANRLLANEMLVPPLAFDSGGDQLPQAVPFLVLFQGTEVLARQAMLEQDDAEGERLIGDVLRWSQLLRNAQPNFLQSILSRYGWTTAFNTLLSDWQTCPDQAARLRYIETQYAENPIEQAEFVESIKAEFHWVVESGGYRKLLADEETASSLMMFLKPPFDRLSRQELLELPEDRNGELRRQAGEQLAILKCLRNGTPIKDWPDFEQPEVDASLADYAKRPNGLGDLFHDQSTPVLVSGMWSVGLSRGPLLEACLLWLRLEETGQEVTQQRFAGLLDPVDGKPLTIDLHRRIVRKRGPDLKTDPANTPTRPGFSVSGDNSVIVVPRWRKAG